MGACRQLSMSRLIERFEKEYKETKTNTPKYREAGQDKTDRDETKENVVKEVAKKLSKSVASSSDSDSDENKDKSMGIGFKDDSSLPEPAPGKSYEVQNGKAVSAVLGVKKSDKSAGLVALVRYSDNNYELVPTSVLCEFAPKEIVSFYESRLRFF
uniref:Chromo shadow domain-containing protein n=1 Tax=Ditylenchus dipsaci TaxID=166011 RepID=A0A915DFD3_9BILA